MKRPAVIFPICFLLCFLHAAGLHADDYYLKATVNGLGGKKIFLTSLYGESIIKLDSAVAGPDGDFEFRLTDEMHPGLYRILLGKTLKAEFTGGEDTYADIVFNHENIRFATSLNQVTDSMLIIESAENKVFYDFMHQNAYYKMRLDMLYQMLRFCPPADAFYSQISKEYHKTLKRQQKWMNSVIAANANTLAGKLIKFQEHPNFYQFFAKTEKLSDAERSEYLKVHFMDEVDFSDSMLLYSNLVTDKVISFLTMFRSKDYSQKQQEEEFKRATDIVMARLKATDPAYNYVLDYLIKGFEKIQQESVLIYISEKYLETSCNNDQLQEEYKGKIERMKKVAVGQKAPEIEMSDINGKPFKLSDIKTSHTLVIFWASWCPHCTKMLPELKKAYESINGGAADNKRKLEVVAFSIDTDTAQWEKIVAEGEYQWINCSELKGWNSEVAKAYNVYATPTLFLLNKERKIVARPDNVADLQKALQ